MKRRSRVGIKVEPTPEPGPLRVHEQVQAAQRLMPKSNAHDVDGPCPCLVCGGPAERSETHVGPWRRHRACEAVQAYPADRLEAAARALGRHLDRIDAQLLGFSVAPYSEVHPEPTWSDDEPTRLRLPWRHVDREALDEAIGRLPELRVDAGLVDSPCTDGHCCWCGRREARGWASYGHTWADGTPAPLCGACAVIFERTGRPDPAWWDAQRGGIAEAVSGVPTMMGETPPAGLRAFAEGDDDGTGEPWSHLPTEALEAFRWAAWGRWGGKYSPPEHREEALERVRAEEAAWSAREAARQAAEGARVDVFGFGRVS